MEINITYDLNIKRNTTETTPKNSLKTAGTAPKLHGKGNVNPMSRKITLLTDHKLGRWTQSSVKQTFSGRVLRTTVACNFWTLLGVYTTIVHSYDCRRVLNQVSKSYDISPRDIRKQKWQASCRFDLHEIISGVGRSNCPGGGRHLGQLLLGMCRWPLRAPTPL